MNSAEARFREAASFFTLFAGSPWKACHVRTGEMEIFVARDGSTANPMTGGVPDTAIEPATALRAPHLGTLTVLAEVGTRLVPGQTYARLDLLGEAIELVTHEGGTVAARFLTVGALAEYDQPLLSLH